MSNETEHRPWQQELIDLQAKMQRKYGPTEFTIKGRSGRLYYAYRRPSLFKQLITKIRTAISSRT